jgi:hypothetical protein
MTLEANMADTTTILLLPLLLLLLLLLMISNLDYFNG